MLCKFTKIEYKDETQLLRFLVFIFLNRYGEVLKFGVTYYTNSFSSLKKSGYELQVEVRQDATYITLNPFSFHHLWWIQFLSPSPLYHPSNLDPIIWGRE